MKTKNFYLFGNILFLIAQVGTLALNIVLWCLSGFGLMIVANVACSVGAIALTICSLCIMLNEKNYKNSYLIAVSTLIVNLFLNVAIYVSNIQFLIWLAIKFVTVAGAIYYAVALCSTIKNDAPKGDADKSQQTGEKPLNEQADTMMLNEKVKIAGKMEVIEREVQKLEEMKSNGLIDEQEYKDLRTRLISKLLDK